MEKDTPDVPEEHGEKKDAPGHSGENASPEELGEQKDVVEEHSEEKDVLEDHVMEIEVGEHDITQCVEEPGHSECLRTKLQGFPVDKRFASGQTAVQSSEEWIRRVHRNISQCRRKSYSH